MKKAYRIVVLIFVAVLVGLLGWRGVTSGVAVTVTNGSGADITSLSVRFTGGRRSAPRVEPAGRFRTRVNPTGESDLVVEFLDASGNGHTNEVDVYLEPDYRGAVRITIQTNGSVTWEDQSKTWAEW